MKPKLLDLFCGAGGASVGYFQAGFDVAGVDIKEMPNYPFSFVKADALEYLKENGHKFDLIHASPPCQKYSKLAPLARDDYPMLIKPVREALIETGKDYVIENVPGAPLLHPTLLCGTMFRLNLYRHRLFETSFPVPLIMHPGHGLQQDKLYGKNRRREVILIVGKGQYKGWRLRGLAAMEIDWHMTEAELSEAIPPAYTKHLGNVWLQSNPPCFYNCACKTTQRKSTAGV